MECADFLQQVLPRLGLQWRGYRRVHKLVCRRVGKRLAELRLPDLASYAAYLDRHPGECALLEQLTHIPVSRFYRDRSVFEALERDILPAIATSAIAEGRRILDCWSACCASGEEAYTLAFLWKARLASAYPSLALRILASDADADMLQRGRAACYGASSIKELPCDLKQAGLEYRDRVYSVRPALRTVEFLQQDIRETGAGPLYDLVLCRNAVLTYFLPSVQEDVMRRVLARLRPGGILVVGLHESLPASCAAEVTVWSGTRVVYRKQAPAGSDTAMRMLPTVLSGPGRKRNAGVRRV